MKILLANWSWYPTGGDWTYIDNVKRLYEKHGHEVIPLSTQNPKNVYSPYSKYFIKTEDFKVLNKNKSIINGFKAVKGSIISFNALEKLDEILKEHQIDLAHLHNIHHYVTPAIVWKLKKNNIKVMWTLHDYKIICPENSFVTHNQVCERCITGNFYNCTTHKCKKDSLPASFLASAEAYFYHKTNVYKQVDAYLCPSDFLLHKFQQFGFDSSVLHLTNYCYDIDYIDKFIASYQASSGTVTQQDYILYVGRIERIKGIKTLLDAMKGAGLHLKIAGSGTASDEFISYAKENNINNVEFLGFQDKSSIFELTYNSKFVICPSEWYENFPFSVIESLLFSKPVIGSAIGGIPELVLDGQTGYLFEAGNSGDLQEKMLKLWNSSEDITRFGKLAREHAYNIVNFENHWSKLEGIIKN